MLQKNLPQFHRRLHDWYARMGRHHLPWRQTRDPYPIWLSEVMLQQTQVATVLARYYRPFLEKFPTLEALAAAPRDAVMKAWEGLGYYRRAGYLHEAAKRVAAQSRGGAAAALPGNVAALMQLPGIGRNTAHAVACFGFGVPVPVMEANLKRVLARIFAWETPSDVQLWEAAYALLDEARSFDYNQAMMDIGATICTPRNPACMLCPANRICRGQAEPARYPAAKAKKEKPVRRSKLLLIYRTDADGTRRYRMTQRETALLGGLFGFPHVAEDAETWESEGLRIALAQAKRLGEVTHAFTHFRMDCTVWALEIDRDAASDKDFYAVGQMDALPLAAIDRKVRVFL